MKDSSLPKIRKSHGGELFFDTMFINRSLCTAEGTIYFSVQQRPLVQNHEKQCLPMRDRKRKKTENKRAMKETVRCWRTNVKIKHEKFF